MEQSVQEFKDLFEELFIKGLPPFWDGKGKLYDQEEYNARLTQCRMDHSKFEILEENLKGATLVEYLIIDFLDLESVQKSEDWTASHDVRHLHWPRDPN